jgi:hypothetical protein
MRGKLILSVEASGRIQNLRLTMAAAKIIWYVGRQYGAFKFAAFE